MPEVHQRASKARLRYRGSPRGRASGGDEVVSLSLIFSSTTPPDPPPRSSSRHRDCRGPKGARSAAAAVRLGGGGLRRDRLAHQLLAIERKVQTQVRRYVLNDERHLKVTEDRCAAHSLAGVAVADDRRARLHGDQGQRDVRAQAAGSLNATRSRRIGHVDRALFRRAVHGQRECVVPRRPGVAGRLQRDGSLITDRVDGRARVAVSAAPPGRTPPSPLQRRASLGKPIISRVAIASATTSSSGRDRSRRTTAETTLRCRSSPASGPSI